MQNKLFTTILLLSLTACFETEHKSESINTPTQGATGQQGATGSKGDKGDKGEVGPQGVAGMQGAKGDVGPKGETGPKGDKGDKGDVGPRGATGPQGPAGNSNNVITRVYTTTSAQHPNAYTIITFIDVNGDFDYQVTERVLGKVYVANTCNCNTPPPTPNPKDPCDKK